MSKSGNFLFLGAQDGAATGCYAGVAVNHWEILDHLAGRPRSALDAEEAEMEKPLGKYFHFKDGRQWGLSEQPDHRVRKKKHLWVGNNKKNNTTWNFFSLLVKFDYEQI
jgi:hypothetical protein